MNARRAFMRHLARWVKFFCDHQDQEVAEIISKAIQDIDAIS